MRFLFSICIFITAMKFAIVYFKSSFPGLVLIFNSAISIIGTIPAHFWILLISEAFRLKIFFPDLPFLRFRNDGNLSA